MPALMDPEVAEPKTSRAGPAECVIVKVLLLPSQPDTSVLKSPFGT